MTGAGKKGAKRKREEGSSSRHPTVSGEKTSLQRDIVRQFDKRSFHRIQMQIPFGESSIIFLTCTKKPETSSFWTNLLVRLVTYDVENNGSKVFFPKHKGCSPHPWGDGLVELPDLLNIGRKKIDVNNVLHRIINGTTSTKLPELDALVDRFLQGDPNVPFLKDHRIAKENPAPVLEWICPDVPPGGIVVWHGFHTTKGDAESQYKPKATMFLDYAERNMLTVDQFQEYIGLIRRQPFDPGAGNPNTRGSRTTIEFNAAKNIPQACPLPNTRMTGRDEPNPTVGKLMITKENVVHQGFAVVAPVRATDPTPPGCYRWEMTENELREYNKLRKTTQAEFERFLTYYIFERELRVLICWLCIWTKRTAGNSLFCELWEKVKGEVDLFGADGKFKFRQDVRTIKNSPFVRELVSKVKGEGTDPSLLKGSKKRPKTMTQMEYTLFNILSLHKLSCHARQLDITANRTGVMDRAYDAQERCWRAIFGGKGLAQTKAAAESMNNPYFMYWRLQMGNSYGNMCTGTSLEDLNRYLEQKLNEGFFAHPHTRCAQSGGIKIAGNSGMGGCTTYVHGNSHVELQVGKYGSTLADAFYEDPIIVFERFRVKTHASWGAAHVDHRVRSRLDEITF